MSDIENDPAALPRRGEEIQIRVIEGVVVHPGDRLLLYVTDDMSPERAQALSEALTEALPDVNTFLVMGVKGVKVESDG